MRAFAAVLLRRLIFRPPLHPVPSPHPHQSIAAPRTTIYDYLSETTRGNLEVILLAALREERDSSALKGITETVCELAVGSFERKRTYFDYWFGKNIYGWLYVRPVPRAIKCCFAAGKLKRSYAQGVRFQVREFQGILYFRS
jgi:hypothetical protein